MWTRRFAAGVLAVLALLVALPTDASGAAGAGGGAPLRSAEFLDAVGKAIDRGVEKLRATQLADGGWAPYAAYPAATTALAYHTIRTCGVPANDPAAERAWEALQREYKKARDSGQMRVYTAGLVMMAIADHALAVAPDRAPKQPGAKSPEPRVPAADLAWMNEMVSYLEGCQGTTGAWRYGDAGGYGRRGAPSDDHDHSNTQYAVQGLRAAVAVGSTVREGTWTKLLRHLLDAQERSGPKVRVEDSRLPGQTGAAVTDRARGWSYYRLDDARFAKPSGGAYGSMTAGCLAAVVIARESLLTAGRLAPALERESEASVRDGVAWLGVHFDVNDNPVRRGWHFYWLYALERAGDLAGVDWMGAHDWYGEGARVLLDRQDADGGWRDAVPDPCSTCFALLFLRRGTKPAVRGSLTPSADEEPLAFAAAAGLGERDFEDFLDLAVTRWRRAKSDRVRDALARGVASIGERIVLPLLRRMDDPDAEVRRAGHGLLARAAGLSMPFDADAPRDARNEALASYEAWVLRTSGRLVYDAELGRLGERR